jgi:hypothetical protein
MAFRLEIPASLKDDAGRVLTNAASFPLKVQTDELPPLAKFAGDFGILESRLPGGAKPLLPVTVRNLEPKIAGVIGGTIAKSGPARATPDAASGAKETIPGVIARVPPGDEMKIVDWLRRIDAGSRIEREYDQKTERSRIIKHGAAQSIFTASDTRETIAVPKPLGAKAFEVIGIPLAAPGFYVVELASPLLGAALFGVRKPYYVRTATLVTNLSVHFKLGRESSLVWVTALSDGKPVKNAQINVRDCAGHSYWKGVSDDSGIARIDRALPARQALPKCNASERREYFVTARIGSDLAFAFSDWGEGISPWRFNVPTRNYEGPFVASAVLDRSLVRAGETVSMKIFVRRQTSQGFAFVPRPPLADTLQIRHRGSERKYTVPCAMARDAEWRGDLRRAAGCAGWNVRDSGSRYARVRFARTAGAARRVSFASKRFAYRCCVRGCSRWATPLVRPTEVGIDVQVSYLSGGGAGGLPVKLRTQFEPRGTTFSDFEDYVFAAGNVAEGREEHGDSAEGFDGGCSAMPATRRCRRAAHHCAHREPRAEPDPRCRRRHAGDGQGYWQGPGRLRCAARHDRRARIPRSERRDADRRNSRADLAVAHSVGHQAR